MVYAENNDKFPDIMRTKLGSNPKSKLIVKLGCNILCMFASKPFGKSPWSLQSMKGTAWANDLNSEITLRHSSTHKIINLQAKYKGTRFKIILDPTMKRISFPKIAFCYSSPLTITKFQNHSKPCQR